MVLNFCKTCGGMLRIQKIDNEKSYLFCDKCQNFEVIKSNNNSGILSKEKIEKQEERGKGAVDSESEFANYEYICEKCGHPKARIMDMGIFYSDEDNLILLRCGKCGFSKRVGRKVS
jgi:DNA-directed RNA polymerase subunit M/transcription elongation factor TFIIS